MAERRSVICRARSVAGVSFELGSLPARPKCQVELRGIGFQTRFAELAQRDVETIGRGLGEDALARPGPGHEYRTRRLTPYPDCAP